MEALMIQKAKKQEATPSIPEYVLNEFLEEQIGISNLSNVVRIKSLYLWSRSDVERYRINVWLEVKGNEEDIYNKNVIGHSFFVHYYKDENVIVDKTRT
jgi:hypothetical protein